MDWNRAHNALSITQDGEPIEGRLQITRGGKDIEFVPYAPFHSGAVVKISLDNADDTDGQLAPRYEGLFTTAASFDNTEPLRAMPGAQPVTPLNSVMEFEYSRPLDRSTVTSTTITLSEDSTLQPVAAGVMLRGDRVIRGHAVGIARARFQLHPGGLRRREGYGRSERKSDSSVLYGGKRSYLESAPAALQHPRRCRN